MQKIRKMVGKVILDGNEYAILSRDEENPTNGTLVYFETRRAANTLLVSRIFSNQTEVEGIQTMQYTYAEPHWVTVVGNAVLHWTNEPMLVEISEDVVFATE